MQKVSLWRAIQRQNFTRLDELVHFLELDLKKRSQILARPRFSLNLPRRLAEKIGKNTLDDPLLRQFVPLKEENEVKEGFCLDPVEDEAFRIGKKLLHKYEGRALLICTGACAMHCRFCFRQNFEYDSKGSFEEELSIIQEDSSLSEIILSGGDPLSLSDAILEDLIDRLSSIPHLKRLRFHSRFPIGIPERIDEKFLTLLSKSGLKIFFVIHCNHPLELDADVKKALKKLQDISVVLLSHTVLLKGVNDDLPTLKALFEELVNQGILPYYLFQLDRVQGAAHFEVDEQRGLDLMQELAKKLPGYALPKYTREIAGQPHKTVISPTTTS